MVEMRSFAVEFTVGSGSVDEPIRRSYLNEMIAIATGIVSVFGQRIPSNKPVSGHMVRHLPNSSQARSSHEKCEEAVHHSESLMQRMEKPFLNW